MDDQNLNRQEKPSSNTERQKELEILLARKEQQLQATKKRVAQLEGQLRQMYMSLSWRITSPLRIAGLRLPQLLKQVNDFFNSKKEFNPSAKPKLIRGQSFAILEEVAKDVGSIGIHVHLHYVDLLDEIAQFLHSVPFSFDLFVSIADENQKENVHDKFQQLRLVRSCIVETVPNRGRDVAPLVTTFAERLLGYEYVCHIHSKKSLFTGTEQVSWRKYLLAQLLGSPEVVRKIFGIFTTFKDVGIIYPETYRQLPYWAHCWLGNKSDGYKLCKRFKINCDFSGYQDSPMGTMFWARTEAIKPILTAGFSFDDFPEEAGQTDGTLAHAMERILVPVAAKGNFTFGEINTEKDRFSLGFGSRNVFQYWEKSTDNLKRAIKHHEIISFDIFDTLLSRPLIDPDFAFDLLAIEVEKITGIKNFKELRKRAEHELRLQKGIGTDVCLDGIYRLISSKLGIDQAVTDKLADMEQQLELSLNGPRHEVVKAFHYAKENNKLVILMSDMYLDESSIRGLLARNGIEEYDELWLSSTIGVRKDDATMWFRLVEKYPSSSILHIGDNEHSDVQIPSDLGIDFYHVMSPRNMLYNSMLGRELAGTKAPGSLGDAAVIGIVSSHLFNDPFALHEYKGDYIFSSEREFGYSVIGPVIFSYLLWLLQSAINEKVATVLFLAREGYLLKQQFDRLIAHEAVAARHEHQIKTVYLLASRRATIVPSIENFDDAKNLLNKPYQGRLHNLLETRFGLSGNYLAMHGIPDHKINLVTDIAAVTEIVAKHFGAIQANAHEERKLYNKYLSNLNLTGNTDRFVVSDIGYGGSIQKALSKLLKVPLAGYYFTTNQDAYDNDRNDNKFYGYFNQNDGLPGTEDAFYKYSLVLESILTAPDGQLICFVDGSGDINPVFGPPDARFSRIAKIQAGITDYCNDMLKYYGKHLLHFHPDKGICLYFFEKVMSEQLYDNDIAALLKVEDRYCSDGEINAM